MHMHRPAKIVNEVVFSRNHRLQNFVRQYTKT